MQKDIISRRWQVVYEGTPQHSYLIYNRELFIHDTK